MQKSLKHPNNGCPEFLEDRKDVGIWETYRGVSHIDSGGT